MIHFHPKGITKIRTNDELRNSIPKQFPANYAKKNFVTENLDKIKKFNQTQIIFPTQNKLQKVEHEKKSLDINNISFDRNGF